MSEQPFGEIYNFEADCFENGEHVDRIEGGPGKPTLVGRGGRFWPSIWNTGEEKADFDTRLAEAQRRYDTLKPGEHMPCDIDLMPYINRTEK